MNFSIRVCNFSHQWADDDLNDDHTLDCDTPLPSNYNEKCFIQMSGNTRIEEDDRSCTQMTRIWANLTSTTNIKMSRSDGDVFCDAADDTAAVTEGYVVCFVDDSAVTVGYEMNVDPNEDDYTTDIGHAVTTSNSWITTTWSVTDDGIEQVTLRWGFLNNDTLRFDRTNDGSADGLVNITWWVIEFENGTQSFVQNLTAEEVDDSLLEYEMNFSIEWETNRTAAVCSDSFGAGGGTAHPRVPWASNIKDNDSITLTRGRVGSGSQNPDLECQAVQWPFTTSYETGTADDQCTCPSSGNFVIDDGSDCTLTEVCDIGSNVFRLVSGSMRVLTSGFLRSAGCYIADFQAFFIHDSGGAFCGPR